MWHSLKSVVGLFKPGAGVTTKSAGCLLTLLMTWLCKDAVNITSGHAVKQPHNHNATPCEMATVVSKADT